MRIYLEMIKSAVYNTMQVYRRSRYQIDRLKLELVDLVSRTIHEIRKIISR